MADETKVGRVKRLLIERVTSILEHGVVTEDEDGNKRVAAGSDKDLRLALDVVKTFHAEVGETVVLSAEKTSANLARFQNRDGAAPSARAN